MKSAGEVLKAYPQARLSLGRPDARGDWTRLERKGDRFILFNDQGDLILAELSPKGYREIDRAHVIDPDNAMPGRPVVWSHPAFADKTMFVRNDHELVCVSLAK